MSSTPIPPALNNPDIGTLYQDVYDALGRAYWDATDLHSKDLVHGAMEAIGDIITAIDEEDLAHNTELFNELKPKIDGVNTALSQIKDQINQITKNIATASTVIAAVSKVLSLFSMV
jgi:archaellum component FlaC